MNSNKLPSYYHKFVVNQFNTEAYEVKLAIEVLWSGWELDDTAWIIEVNNNFYCVVSHHGSPTICQEEWLLEKINQYAQVTADTIKAIELLRSNKPSL